MIEHVGFTSYLRREGFCVGQSGKTQFDRLDKYQFAALSDERGVLFHWNVCEGDNNA